VATPVLTDPSSKVPTILPRETSGSIIGQAQAGQPEPFDPFPFREGPISAL